MRKLDKATLVRTIVLIVALINQVLVMAGINPLPFESEEIEMGVTSVFTVAATLWTWYKNNDTTDEARAGTQYMKELKESKKGGGK